MYNSPDYTTYFNITISNIITQHRTVSIDIFAMILQRLGIYAQFTNQSIYSKIINQSEYYIIMSNFKVLHKV